MTRQWRMMIVAGVLAAAWSAGAAWGQQQIYQGNVLDASNRLGSGGINQPRPLTDFGLANRVMSGNVAGGMSFRGYSPIRDPGTFFVGGTVMTSSQLVASSGYTPYSRLPSDTLNAFSRDSFNLADFQRKQGTWGAAYGGLTPYYSPWTTVLNTGAIVAGQNRIGTSQVQNPYGPAPGSPGGPGNTVLASVLESQKGGRLLEVPAMVVRATTGQPVTGNVNPQLLVNPLFAGAFAQVPVSQIAGQIRQEQGQASSALAAAAAAAAAAHGGAAPAVAGAAAPQPGAAIVQPLGPIDLRISPARAANQRPLTDRIPPSRLEGTAQTLLGQVLEQAAQDGDLAPVQGGAPRPSPARVAEPGGPAGAGPAEGGVGLAGAGDVFARLQAAGQVRAAAGAAPADAAAAAMSPAVMQALTSEEFAVGPLKTFVGTESSAVNRHLKYAEEALKAGRYYRAVEAYDAARTVAPDNALAALGRSMALLGAGDYVSSASGLFEAIRLFDALSHFDVDLRSFVPDLTVLDSRRADLEKRLGIKENGRLRFLLGFAEYNSGLKDLGLKNMEKGRQFLTQADADLTAVQRFLEGLRSRAAVGAKPVEVPSGK